MSAASVLAACAVRDPFVYNSKSQSSGDWTIERQTDRITGAPITSAFVTTRASNSIAEYPKPAMLQLACFKGAPLIRLSFEFKIGSDINSTLGYRFDDKPGHEIDPRFLQNFMIVVIENKADVAQIVSELTTSKLLYIQIRSINAGRTAAEFRIEGAQAAVDAVVPHCAPAAPEPPRSRGVAAR